MQGTAKPHLPHLNKEYGRDVAYSGLMDLVYRAMVV